MDRRETLKTLLVGTVAGGAVLTGAAACKKEAEAVAETVEEIVEGGGYGRTPKEQAHDKKLQAETYFNAHEMATIAVLCDIILPADEVSGSATDAEVPAFVEFMVKDLPYHQLPLRGGLMWLDHEANRRFKTNFISSSDAQQIEIVEDIAYPPMNEKEEKERAPFAQGIKFFSRLRNLTLTGFYTTKMGIDDLGYVGNRPNIWDGVPDEVLQKHGLAYEEDWLAKCINQETRMEIAEWDADGNLLT